MREIWGVRPLVCVPLERAISFADEVVPWLVAIAQQGWGFGLQAYGRTDVTRNRFAATMVVCLDHKKTSPRNRVSHLAVRPGR